MEKVPDASEVFRGKSDGAVVDRMLIRSGRCG